MSSKINLFYAGDSIEYSYAFVSSLIANAFFSTYPKRTAKTHPTLRDFNFTNFFRHLHKWVTPRAGRIVRGEIYRFEFKRRAKRAMSFQTYYLLPHRFSETHRKPNSEVSFTIIIISRRSMRSTDV